jgi:serine/threonine protein kinase
MAVHFIPFGRFYFSWLERLGEGGLGYVHKIRVDETNAPDKPVASEWACKRLNPKWNAHPEMRVRFEREISALQTMSHRNIVTFEGANLPEGTERFYVMPVYSNTLRRYVATGRNRDDWRFFADLAVTLADAMQYAHGLGFIHRDLKPENILFNGGGPLDLPGFTGPPLPAKSTLSFLISNA